MVKLTLKAARVNMGFTQGEVAKKLGKSEKSIWNWENFKSYPDAKEIAELCELYKVSYDNIIFFKTKND